jgi:hypothetical protein
VARSPRDTQARCPLCNWLVRSDTEQCCPSCGHQYPERGSRNWYRTMYQAKGGGARRAADPRTIDGAVAEEAIRRG